MQIHTCCKKHHKHLNDLKKRSVALLFLGCLSLIPYVETILTSGSVFGLLFFVVSSACLGASILHDLDHLSYYAVGTTLACVLLLLAPALSPTMFISLSIFVAGVMIVSLLFMNTDKLPGSITSKIHFFAMPSTEKIVILITCLNWTLTFGSLLFPTQQLYAYLLHDCLLLLGSFNFSMYLKQKLQSTYVPHNHSKKIEVVYQGQKEQILISELKKGMELSIKTNQPSFLLPVKCVTCTESLITEDETRELKVKGSIVPAEATLHEGTIRCDEDYTPFSHTYQYSHTETEDGSLNKILLTFFMIVLGFSLNHYITSGVYSAIHSFCMNMLVGCPCVFVLTRPIIAAKLSKWLRKSSIEFLRMPNIKTIHFVVFDRTNTLYKEDPMNTSGRYILVPEAKKILSLLKKEGIECFILSGHGTQGWKENLKACKEELSGAIDPKNIIFDRRYHCRETQAKASIIKNLQRYGSVLEPQYALTRFYYRFKSIFYQYSVVMIGDGGNDAKALEQADLAVAISETKDNIQRTAQLSSHFALTQDKLVQLLDLFSAVKLSGQCNHFFKILGVVCNFTMLFMINGLSSYLLGFVPSVSLACLGMTFICPMFIAIAIALPFRVQIHQSRRTVGRTRHINPLKHQVMRRPPYKNMSCLKGCCHFINDDKNYMCQRSTSGVSFS